MPNYDRSIIQLFIDAAKSGILSEIILLDPNSQILLERWNVIVPGTKVRALPGLPEGLRRLATY
jgi:hypothetical protein